MESLDIAQQLKIIKDANLSIPVYRAPSDDYDIERPTKFDRHVGREDIKVNASIGFLLNTINYLAKELILSNDINNKELWKNLADIKKILQSSRNTQSNNRR